MRTLLAIDPGDTTGLALFNLDTGDGIELKVVKTKDALYEYLSEIRPDKIVCEDFELFPWKSKEQSWSNFSTVRVIGAIEYYCYLTQTPLTLQKASIKPIAYKWAGMTKASNHAVSHDQDAYVHGVYFLQRMGLRKPQQGKTIMSEEGSAP